MDWPIFHLAFFKGTNERDNMQIENEQSSSSLNCLLDHKGILQSGNGRAKRNLTAITSTPHMLDLHRFYLSNGTKKFLAGGGTNLYLGSETTGWAFTSIKDSLAAGLKGRYQTFKDRVFRLNGTNANLKYDVTDGVVNMGVETPSAPAVATGASGNLTGDYYYKASYQVDGYSEGNASDASSLVQPSSDKVTVTKPTSTPEADVTHWIVYRTKAGAGIYYKLTTVAIGTGSYSDNTIDDNLDTGNTAPSDNSAPGVCDFIALFHRYIFILKASTSRVYFSTQDYPEKFPAAYYFDISPQDGENVTGIIEGLGSMYCFKKNSIYAICGNDTTDFGVPPNKWSRYGCYAPDTLKVVNWKGSPIILYLHKTGLRAWDGTLSHLLSADIQTTIDSISDDYIHLACGELKGQEYWLSFCTSGTVNNETWILNLETGDWRQHNYGVNGLMSDNEGNLWAAVQSGFIYQLAADVGDLGGNLSWEYTTKNWSFPHKQGDINRGRFFIVWASLETDVLTLDFTVDDNDTGNKTLSYPLKVLGASKVKTVISLPKNLVGEFFKVKYSSTGTKRCTIYRIELVYIPIPRRQ